MNKEAILASLPDAESMTLPTLRAFVREHGLGLVFKVGTKKIDAYSRIVDHLKDGIPEEDTATEEEKKVVETADNNIKGKAKSDPGIPPFLLRRMDKIKAAQAKAGQVGGVHQNIDTRLRLRQEGGAK